MDINVKRRKIDDVINYAPYEKHILPKIKSNIVLYSLKNLYRDTITLRDDK
tara:strand:+ start:88 stop:240 length:153 start_codon:yes stop_codon:yes gene_type:complete